jgi:hypothetical protein
MRILQAFGAVALGIGYLIAGYIALVVTIAVVQTLAGLV